MIKHTLILTFLALAALPESPAQETVTTQSVTTSEKNSAVRTHARQKRNKHTHFKNKGPCNKTQTVITTTNRK